MSKKGPKTKRRDRQSYGLLQERQFKKPLILLETWSRTVKLKYSDSAMALIIDRWTSVVLCHGGLIHTAEAVTFHDCFVPSSVEHLIHITLYYTVI